MAACGDGGPDKHRLCQSRGCPFWICLRMTDSLLKRMKWNGREHLCSVKAIFPPAFIERNTHTSL